MTCKQHSRGMILPSPKSGALLNDTQFSEMVGNILNDASGLRFFRDGVVLK